MAVTPTGCARPTRATASLLPASNGSSELWEMLVVVMMEVAKNQGQMVCPQRTPQVREQPGLVGGIHAHDGGLDPDDL